jgi:hypothetical protein
MAFRIFAQRVPLDLLATLLGRRRHPHNLRSGAPMPERMLQHAGNTDACGTFTPEDGGPTALVVGTRASKDDLRRLAARHGLELDALLRFAQSVAATGGRHGSHQGVMP